MALNAAFFGFDVGLDLGLEPGSSWHSMQLLKKGVKTILGSWCVRVNE
jgi:hypothetical protein